MKKFNLDNTFILFLAGAVLTGTCFLALSFLDKTSYLHSFFFRCWHIQAITTWLFEVAIIFVMVRFYNLKKEKIVLDEKVSVERLDTVDPKQAKTILEVIPAKYKDAISFRRISELLRGYLYKEEVVRLNQELSRRDIEEVERGHLVLNALCQLIPVLGFLGTVIGLSLAMAKFPELSGSADSIDKLRYILKDFAASLSVAFDTTLLALGYTVVVSLISSLLKRKEEAFVTELDAKARLLITKLSYLQKSPEAQDVSGLGRILEQMVKKNGSHNKELVEILCKNGDAVLSKLDELKQALHTPPKYEIVVQPVKEKINE